MNFRRDSDIIDSYGAFVGKSGEDPPVFSYAYSKQPTGFLKQVLVIETVSLNLQLGQKIGTLQKKSIFFMELS